MCVSTTWKEWNGPLLRAEKLSSTNLNSSWPCLYCIKNILNRLYIHFHWIFIMTNSECNNNKLSTGYRRCGDINSKFMIGHNLKTWQKKNKHTHWLWNSSARSTGLTPFTEMASLQAFNAKVNWLLGSVIFEVYLQQCRAIKKIKLSRSMRPEEKIICGTSKTLSAWFIQSVCITRCQRLKVTGTKNLWPSLTSSTRGWSSSAWSPRACASSVSSQRIVVWNTHTK